MPYWHVRSSNDAVAIAYDFGRLALKFVFLLMASTIFCGVAFLGSYLTHADFVAGSGFASITPETFMSAALTAAAHELQIIPSTRSSISLVSCCIAPTTRELTRTAAPTTKQTKSLRIMFPPLKFATHADLENGA